MSVPNPQVDVQAYAENRRSHYDPVVDFPKHFKYLLSPFTNEIRQRNKYPYTKEDKMFLDLEFSFIEWTSKQPEFTPKCEVSSQEKNSDKNRYDDILAPDATRVLLVPTPNEPSDYINANFIRNSEGEIKYISTQGPKDNTVVDFWRLVWDHKIPIFVMLTRVEESGQQKSATYWPKVGETQTYGSIEVRLDEETSDNPTYFVKRKFTVQPNQPQPLTVLHIQYTGWPDRGTPGSPKEFLELLDLVDNESRTRPGYVGIHCSAGIGRTGTFCTVHIVRNELKKHFELRDQLPQFNVVKTILNLRKQRPGMVQTKEQYYFCYRAIYDEWMRLYKQAKERFGTKPQ